MFKPEAYDVEWLTDCTKDENGDTDPHSGIYRTRRFPTLPLARAFAKEAARLSYWGVADVCPVARISRATLDAELETDEGIEFSIQKGAIWAVVGECEEVEA